MPLVVVPPSLHGRPSSCSTAIWSVFSPNFLVEPGQSADKVWIIYEEYLDHLCSRYAVTAGMGREAAGMISNTEANWYSLVALPYLIFGRRKHTKIKCKIKFCSSYLLIKIFLLLKPHYLCIWSGMGRVADPKVKSSVCIQRCLSVFLLEKQNYSSIFCHTEIFRMNQR